MVESASGKHGGPGRLVQGAGVRKAAILSMNNFMECGGKASSTSGDTALAKKARWAGTCSRPSRRAKASLPFILGRTPNRVHGPNGPNSSALAQLKARHEPLYRIGFYGFN
jgi:hypothetical protein